jgi:hypothetical protein
MTFVPRITPILVQCLKRTWPVLEIPFSRCLAGWFGWRVTRNPLGAERRRGVRRKASAAFPRRDRLGTSRGTSCFAFSDSIIGCILFLILGCYIQEQEAVFCEFGECRESFWGGLWKKNFDKAAPVWILVAGEKLCLLQCANLLSVLMYYAAVMASCSVWLFRVFLDSIWSRTF